MKKLRLNAEDLDIELFEIEAASDGQGTVRGLETDPGTSCIWKLCTGAPITYSCDACN